MSSCVEPGTSALREGPRAVRQECSGDREFQRLYSQYFDEVMTFVLRYGVNHSDAEDLVQRIFVIALGRGDDSEPLNDAGHWLRAVALRVLHQHYRWRRVRRAAEWLLELTWAADHNNELTPEREASASESLEQVRGVLSCMSIKLRDTLVLLDVEGMAPSEAARVLGVPRNTLRSRHRLARDEFKRLWTQRRKA